MAAATLLIGIVSWRGQATLMRQERQYRNVREAALANSARAAVELAERALAKGDLVDAEMRLSQAQDWISAPALRDRPPVELVKKIAGMESRYADRFREIRRQRALNRIKREGIERTR